MKSEPTSGVITLGMVADRLAVMEIACNRCDRHGRLHTARLIARYGPTMSIPSLRRVIAEDCPRMQAGKLHDICGVHFLQLPQLF